MSNNPHSVTLTIDADGGHEFTGGTDNHGNCNNDTNQGAAPVHITLSAPSGYRIQDMGNIPPGVQLSGTGKEQMGPQVTGQGQSAIITNPCTSRAEVDYTVNVRTPAGGNIPCHPKIVNT